MNNYSYEVNGMHDEELMYDLADFFKVFADSTRIRILYCLMEGEKCVGDIAETLEMSQTAISHQLRVLKANRIVRYRRDGKQMYYCLADDHVKSILAAGLEHVEE